MTRKRVNHAERRKEVYRMKTTKVYEIECMRHNVTPGQFLAYVRSQCKKHGGNMEYSAATFASDGWNAKYSDELPDGRTGCASEIVTDKPYEKQTYVLGHDGTCYNQILEFDFWDEKTGTGYYYEVQTEVKPEDIADNVKECCLDIARRAIHKAERLEAKAAKAVDSIDEWTSKSWAEMTARAARWDREEAAELREKAAKVIEKLPEYVAMYTGQEEAQPAQEEAEKASQEGPAVFYIPETGETVTAAELAEDIEKDGGEYPSFIPGIIAEMAAEGVIIQISGEAIQPPEDMTGHDWLTPENIEKLRAALAQARADYAASPARYHVKISDANIKMGAVPSVSLLPVLFCPGICRGCHGCGHFCYALKLAMIRKSVLRSWAMNTAILLLDWRKYWEEIRRALASYTRFRFHVSGEILNRAYFDEMAKAAADFPGCDILDFTKQYDTVNAWLDCHEGQLPGRLHVLFSGLDGVPMNNPYNLPVTRVIMTGTDPEDIPESWQICPGHCEECAARGVHCWDSQPGQVIAFWQH